MREVLLVVLVAAVCVLAVVAVVLGPGGAVAGRGSGPPRIVEIFESPGAGSGAGSGTGSGTGSAANP